MSAVTLVDKASAIRAEHEAAQRCASEAVAHAIRAGELLLEAKAAVPHGAFGIWLASNVAFSTRTAQGYMRLARLDEQKRNALREQPLRQALLTIATPRHGPVLETLSSLEELARLPQEELDAIRLGALERFCAIAEDILAVGDFANLDDEDRQKGLSTQKWCDEALTDLAAKSPNARHLYTAMLGSSLCREIGARLRNESRQWPANS